MRTLNIPSQAEYPDFAEKKMCRKDGDKPIYTGELSGVKYYDYGFASYLLRIGSHLNFQREPKNSYDFYAVAVWYKNWKLGYIPKNQNEILSNMLDQNIPLEIRVKNMEDNWERYGAGLQVEVTLQFAKTRLRR